MGKTVETTASSVSDRGSCEVLFSSHGERGQGQDQSLSSLSQFFVGPAGLLGEPLFCGMITAATVRALIVRC